MDKRHRGAGGYARAAAMTPAERSAVAQKAAAVRWSGDRKPTEPKPRIKVMPDVSTDTASRAQEYAWALCDARKALLRADLLYANTGRDAPEALPYFDGVKRVMEIDVEVTDPNVILLRLSVDVPT